MSDAATPAPAPRTSGAATPAPAERYVDRLDAQAAAIPALLAGREPADLERRTPDGKWSAREQLAHLARYHEVFLERLDRMLAEPAPRFGRYRAENDPEWARWEAMPMEEVQRRFDALRADLARRVGALGDAELQRTGVHPAFGEMPVALWLEFFLAHEGHHLYVMFQRARQAPPAGA